MATQAEDKSLSQLEREAEQTRADLIHTVDELHSRVSPQAIKDEVKAYARDTGNELIHTLERKARDNPLQTVAVAAGLAYPAWRFLINIPAPILLVGAGLALSQFGGSFHAKTVRDANMRAGIRGRHEEGEQLTDSLRRTVQDAPSNLSHAAEALKEKVADAAEQAKSGLGSGLGAIRSRAAAAISDTTEAASDTMTAASDAVSATYRSGSARASGENASDFVRWSFAFISGSYPGANRRCVGRVEHAQQSQDLSRSALSPEPFKEPRCFAYTFVNSAPNRTICAE